MAMTGTRTETDSFGPLEVPADRYWGAQTQRSILNFPIGWERQPVAIIRALGVIKKACALVNVDQGDLAPELGAAIAAAASEVIEGHLDDNFPLVVWQTGSGTQSNMNANEVISNRAIEMLGGVMGSKTPVHPNDHCNMGQSSNDTFPTAIHIAAVLAIRDDLIPALERTASTLEQKARDWDAIVKIGRTHLQDATPIRLGQEFSGYASQLRHGVERCRRALDTLAELPIGGTAVGTGINAHEDFGRLVCERLAQQLNFHFREAANHFEAQHAKDAVVETGALLKTIAVSLTKIANDIRLMGMGPRCGIGELKLPAVQPGSSIMPGKVNPVICEAVMMVACRVIGNDAAITTGGLGGVGSLLDLNVAMPVMADALLESITLLARACDVLNDKCLMGLEPDVNRCNELIEGSLAMCTSLVPVIGYDASAALAKQAYAEGKTVRQLAIEKKLLPEAELARLLDPHAMTLPGGEGSAGG